jgi:hypothetical protein
MAANFAITPAHADGNALVNLLTDKGKKFYNKAIAPIYDTNKYDLSSNSLKTFLDAVEDRINEQNWHDIFTIPINGIQYDLVTQFGKITITDVKAHYDAYIPLQDRNGQNDYFSYLAIMGSLSETARARVSLKKSDYMIGKNGSGPLLLCTIIKLAYVINKGTVLHLQKQLNLIENKMGEFNNDITAFNEYVQSIIIKLAGFGESSTNTLMNNLFDAYEAASDDAFTTWIKRRRDIFEEEDDSLTPTDLMALAQDKYTSLKDKGKWNVLSKQEEEFIALQATLKAYTSGSSKRSPSTSSTSNSTISTKKSRTSTDASKSSKRSNKSKTKYDEKWLFIGPNNNEKETKTKDGKEYYWCKYHKKWSINPKHTSALCSGRGLTGEHQAEFNNDHADTSSVRLTAAVAKLETSEDPTTSDDE